MSTRATAEVPATEAIQPDESQLDVDSGIGDDHSTYTESVRSSILESLKENGRGYHKYQSQANYILPEDEAEQQRLDLQHAIALKAFGKLSLAPCEDLHIVLDLGTGTGIWAIEFADQHPEADVLGVDLSPIQPSWVPPNCKFEIESFDEDWTYTQKFSLIHGRGVNPFCADFRKLFQQSFDALEEGGWLEMQDIYLPMKCDDGTADGTDFQKWNDAFAEACHKIGKDPGWPEKYTATMTEIGFENVTERIFKWPINAWPKDKHMKEIGEWNLVNMLDGLEGFTNRLFTGVLGWSMEEVEAFLVGVRKDLQNKAIHSYWKWHVVYAQKPSSSKAI